MNCKQCSKYPPGVDGLCDECRVNNLKGDNDSLRKENFELRATLAERDRQLAEKDDRISWLETQREVECQQKNDANAEVESFCHELRKAQAQLADSQRQKAELEGKAVSLCEDLIKMVEEYHSCDWDEEPFTPDFVDLDKRLQSLRSTQTEEKK